MLLPRLLSYYLLLLIAVLFAPYLSRAQLPQFHFNRLDNRNGISHNQINSIYKDEKGFVWFGTMSGLNRYDGYNFKVYRNIAGDTTSISDNYIGRIMGLPEKKMYVVTRNRINIYDPASERFDRDLVKYLRKWNLPDGLVLDIKKDDAGNFWFLFQQQGLFCYLPSEKRSVSYKNELGTHITAFDFDGSGGLWLIKNDGLIQRTNRNKQLIYQTAVLQQKIEKQVKNFSVFADAENDLWIRTSDNESSVFAEGVYFYSLQENAISYYHTEGAGRLHLNSDIISGIIQDDSGLIWIGTDQGGINLIDKKKGTIQYLLKDPYDEKSISQNAINTIYKDNAGIIWMGTFKRGVSYYNQNITRFPLIEYKPSNPQGLSYGDINCFEEDDAGNVWIGANGGGLIYYNRKTNRFINYKHNPADQNSLSNNVVVSLFLDRNKMLWIGTYFGGLDCFDGKVFRHYRHNAADPQTIADNRIWQVVEDNKGFFWIGTFDGLERLDPHQNVFYHYKVNGKAGAISSNFITAITQDRKQNLWVATAYGLNMLNPDGQTVVVYKNDINNKNSISKNNIICIFDDSRGYLWAGTREGLNIIDPATKNVKRLYVDDGLPDNTIQALVEDNQGAMWISTPNGLSKITVKGSSFEKLSFSIENFTELNNLQAKDFNERSVLKLKSGELLFGGPNGFNIFYPGQIIENRQSSPVVITDLQIFNQSVKAGKNVDDRIITDISVTEAEKIVLKYRENVFSLEFAALNFSQNIKERYAYMLEGFNEDWMITDGSSRKATYTNLDPGTYTFKVKAADAAGKWGQPAMLTIVIKPPFWRTPWAFVILAALCIAALYFSRRITLEKARLKFRIEQQKLEAERLHELDMMKIRFFTNVSHEFRTPISLILAPADKMMRQIKDPGQIEHVQLIKRNARRLLNMVNQLLDFRKLEEQELSLSLSKGDVIQFIKETSLSFVDLAENKKISFSFHSDKDSFWAYLDYGKLERIIFNLISNAFKFTPQYGDVKVTATIVGEGNKKNLEIKVQDTGIGIETEKQEKIFEQFFQNNVPGSFSNYGSGIGLAITKEFVQLHRGEIKVNSEINKGSTFIVTIPVQEITEQQEMLPLEQQALVEKSPVSNTERKENGKEIKSKTVLLVEDNEDFRFYLKDNLKEYFNVVEAYNGKTGWQKALANHPDIIVSDINMPEMNGVELCQKIKNDPRTSYIPVILLTALAGEEDQLQSLNSGADDYMAKPFNFEILYSKINNFLLHQDKLRKTFQRQVQVQPTTIAVNNEDEDEKFIRNVFELVEENLSNIDFSVEEMSRKLHMSRAGLYKKLFMLTGKSPIEFIKDIRLKKAEQLLKTSKMTISEIAYEVGFNPKSFSKNFKAAYNMLPSEYATKYGNG